VTDAPKIDRAHLRQLCRWDIDRRRNRSPRRMVHAGLTWPGLVLALLDELEAVRHERDERAATIREVER
jgi:hypothetical protein